MDNAEQELDVTQPEPDGYYGDDDMDDEELDLDFLDKPDEDEASTAKSE